MADESFDNIQADSVGQTICPKCNHAVDVSGVKAFSSVQCPHCRAKFSAPGKLDRFILLKPLGKGGMGITYKAYEQALGRHVAIKVMRPSLSCDHSRVEAFFSEARALASLEHPGIASAYAVGEAKNQPYIVMELIDGKGLDQLSPKGKGMDEVRVLKIAVSVAGALQAAHEIGLMHGDIKPSNIMLNRQGQAKLVDFGLARFGAGPDASGKIVGTPYYLAPEQIRKQTLNFRTDICCLGATLYRVLTGQYPFKGKTAKEVMIARLQKPVPDPRTVKQSLRPETARCITRMMHLDPRKRYDSFKQLLGELRRAYQIAKGQPGQAVDSELVKALQAGANSRKTKPTQKTVPKAPKTDLDETPVRKPASRKKNALPMLIGGGVLALGGIAALIAAIVVLNLDNKPDQKNPQKPQPQATKPKPTLATKPQPPEQPTAPEIKTPDRQDQLDQLEKPSFLPSGCPIAGPMGIIISSNIDEADIRYTVDGKDPTKDSPLYMGPVRIKPGTTIKAKVYCKDWRPSEIVQAVYPQSKAKKQPDTPSLPGGQLSMLIAHVQNAKKQVAKVENYPEMSRYVKKFKELCVEADKLYKKKDYSKATTTYRLAMNSFNTLAVQSRNRYNAIMAQKATIKAAKKAAGRISPKIRKINSDAMTAYKTGEFEKAQQLWKSMEKALEKIGQQRTALKLANKKWMQARKNAETCKGINQAKLKRANDIAKKANDAIKAGKHTEAVEFIKRATKILNRAIAKTKSKSKK